VPPDLTRGVFETLLARDGRVQALPAHLRRLTRSVATLYGAELPPELPGAVLAAAAPLAGEHRVRVDVVPGDTQEVTWRIGTSPLAAQRPRWYRCRPAPAGGGLGSHKWSDRRSLAALAARGDDTVALLVDEHADLLEAAWANVWLLDGDRLVTPPADGRILPGVTRARLIALAPSLGLQPSEEPLALARAQAVPQRLLTSSLALAAAFTLPGETAPTPEALAAADRIRDALGAGDWT
jgi:para-aminobenzoate synthetase/4-amino-4-deoxychorismate lyase